MTTLTEIEPRRLGPHQTEYVERVYGHAFFRDGKPLVEQSHYTCPQPEQPARAP